MRAQAVPSTSSDAKNEFYLTYDSQTAPLAGEAARTICVFYLEEEQEEDGISASRCMHFQNRDRFLK
jgi:hypothetical protein